MALAGLILGWAGIALFTAVIAGLIVAASIAAHAGHAIVVSPVPGKPFGPFGGPGNGG